MIENTKLKDKFWFYLGITMFVIISGILMVNVAENEKCAPVKQQAVDEKTLMNIRVLN